MSGKIHPVILSGGTGTRLWPLSRATYPKQFLSLNSEHSLFQETISRVLGDDFFPPWVICNEEHRFVIAEQIRQLGVDPSAIILEPEGRNTAPAVAVAALSLAEIDENAVMLILPSDHIIRDQKRFWESVETAAAAVRQGALVTFGIPPLGPETGYGYIGRGAAFEGVEGCFTVERFVEKPDAATAASLLEEGGYDWNSGLFLFPVLGILAELERLNPAMLGACRASVAAAERDMDFLRLDAEPFRTAENISIDHAVMEKTRQAAVVPVDMGWDDIGSWKALWSVGDKDPSGNVSKGDVLVVDSRDSYIYSEGKFVAAVGLENMVVVVTDDAVLVMPKDRSQGAGEVVSHLKNAGRSEYLLPARVHRPWGHYQSMDRGARFQVKRITVKPGAKLSLQSHRHRAEHWVVVSGKAKVIRGDETIYLEENQSTYIPSGVKHSLENEGTDPLDIIEIQSGSYLGEDDIIRFEDRYGRAD